MSRFDFVRPGGRWLGDFAPGSTDFQRFDDRQNRAMSGTGGTYAPPKPIIVGGAGVQGHILSTGGVTTTRGGRLVVGATDDNAPALSPSISRTVTVPLIGAHVGSADLVTGPQIWGVSNVGTIYIPGRYLHQGASLQRVELDFIVTEEPDTLPTSAVLMKPFSTSLSTNTQVPIEPASFWSSGVPVTVGTYVRPSGQAASTGPYFKVTSISGTGTTGGSEPSWPPQLGDTVTDNPGPNQVVWTAIGQYAGFYPGKFATSSTYYAGGGPQTLATDVLPGLTETIDQSTFLYGVQISNGDNSIVFTGLRVTYSGIASLDFE